jgi:hypothetical protein
VALSNCVGSSETPVSDFERRLREQLGRERDAFIPSGDLPARIAQRTRQREQRRQAVIGAGATLTVIAVAVVALTAVGPGNDRPKQVVVASRPTTSVRSVNPTTMATTTTTPKTTITTVTTARVSDIDGDGVPDGADFCPDTVGQASDGGCPKGNAPTAVADSYVVFQGQKLWTSPPGFLNNDTDPDGPPPALADLVSQDFATAAYNFKWSGDGSFSLDAPSGSADQGPVSVHFTYRARDATGLTSAPVTVTISIIGGLVA